MRRFAFIDVYEHPATTPRAVAPDIVIVAVVAGEVGTAGGAMLIQSALAAYKAGTRRGLGVAVVGAEGAQPLTEIRANVGEDGQTVIAEPIVEDEEFRDTLEGWLCRFAALATGLRTSPEASSSALPDRRRLYYPYGDL